MWGRWYGSIVQKFRTWAESDPDVRAALIVGSQARTDVPADEWSDLDIVIFHSDPARLIASIDWFQSFGTVLLSTVESTAVGGSRERRVLYADGRDVDFSIFPSTAIPFLTSIPEGVAVLGRGFVVLLDKDRGLDKLPSIVATKFLEPLPPSTEEAFRADVSDFCYHALWTAKKLRRGETWTAKLGCDGYLKQLLRRMIQWNVLVLATERVDVWHEGRFLDQWAPSEVRSLLPETFARYDHDDIARALRATGQLYARLARQIADKRGWSYPADAEVAVWKMVDRTLADLPSPG